jgi:hypothetical protein
MSLTREHIQEDFSSAYISAVAAKSGYDCACFGKHDYGIDIEINAIELVGGKRYPTGLPLRIQAKSSHSFEISSEGEIVHDLKVRNYNLLIREDPIPTVLVLYCMPSNDNEWLEIKNDKTILKHCGYWISLRGKEPTSNDETIRIKIPGNQIFDDAALRYIMTTIRDGGFP